MLWQGGGLLRSVFKQSTEISICLQQQSFKLAAPQTKRGVVLLSAHTLNKSAAHLTRYCVYADMVPLRIPLQACRQPPRHRNCHHRGPTADCLSPGLMRLHSKGSAYLRPRATGSKEEMPPTASTMAPSTAPPATTEPSRFLRLRVTADSRT